MKIRTVTSEAIKNKKVLLRVDFNVPIKDGRVIDDSRIRAHLETIRFLSSNGAITVLVSHLGRPKGKRNDAYSLRPIAAYFKEVLSMDVQFVDDCVGEVVKNALSNGKPQDVLLLENCRFHPEEELNDESFAALLAEPFDVFVMDAFSAAHRAHATTRGVTKFLPAYAGFLLEKEVSILSSVRDNPEPPLALILGGSKVTDKIGVIEHMANKASTILVGGAMAFPFLVAKGYSVGKSKCDEENVTCARHILKVLEDEEVEIILPVDIVVGESINSQQASGVVKVDNVPDNMMGLDIGPQTVKEFSKHLGKAKSIIWNGPLGLFENPAFSRGTMEIGKIVSEKAKEGAVVVIGGGDTAAAAKALGFASGVTHVSTGGGASLEFLEGKILPGIEPLLE